VVGRITALRHSLRQASRSALPDGLQDVPDPVARHFVNLGGFEVAWFLRQLTPTKGRVLVVGVGTGRDYYYLGLENEVVALDLVPQDTVPEVVLADFADELPFPDASFDAIVVADVLEHVFDDRAALLNCRRVLKDDGVFVLNVPYGDDIGDHHVRVYTRSTLHRLLRSVGFDVEREVERGPIAHLDRYIGWRALFHGFHLVRWWVSGNPHYERSLRRLVAVDWWFGSRRCAPTRFTKRHGAYIRAVKGSVVDYTAVNRELYVHQGRSQMSES
jgi:SAM-dependent methyltransferase